MDIQQQPDEWALSQIEIDSHSLFSPLVIQYDDQLIQHNLDELLSKPMGHIEDPEIQKEEEEEEMKAKKQSAAGEQKENSNQEALYNPLEDDDNEEWMNKLTKNQEKKKLKPLICPSCFTQIAYEYQKKEDEYRSKNVYEVIPKENLVIRNKNSPETMIYEQQMKLNQKARALRQRQADFNVKIVCECVCGVVLGYYDVNTQEFALTNVI